MSTVLAALGFVLVVTYVVLAIRGVAAYRRGVRLTVRSALLLTGVAAADVAVWLFAVDIWLWLRVANVVLGLGLLGMAVVLWRLRAQNERAPR